MARKKVTHQSSRRRQGSLDRAGAFLRRPMVQFGIILAAVVVIVAIVLAGNKAPAAPTASTTTLDIENLPQNVSAQDAYSLYQRGDVFFLDVREQGEWDSGRIPLTNLIPLGELSARLNEVPREQPIVVVCRSGNRSQQGRDILLSAGFTNVTSMDGGVRAWGTAGYPFEGQIP